MAIGVFRGSAPSAHGAQQKHHDQAGGGGYDDKFKAGVHRSRRTALYSVYLDVVKAIWLRLDLVLTWGTIDRIRGSCVLHDSGARSKV